MFAIRNFLDSLKGVFIGFILIVIAILLIYWNEGRIDYATLAKKSQRINVENAAANIEFNQKFISATGEISAPSEISDELFLVPGHYVSVKRITEVYAWTETKASRGEYDSANNLNVEDQKYSYEAGWVANAPDSTKFRFPGQHINLAKTFSDTQVTAEMLNLGDYKVYTQGLTLPTATALNLTAANVNLSTGATLVNNAYIYVGQGTMAQPAIGDQRISYEVVPDRVTVTIFGKLVDDRITAYADANNNQLFRMFLGDRENAINTLHAEYTGSLWAIRVFGFLMIWIGFCLLLAPLSAVFGFMPVLGGALKTASQTVIRMLTFIVALILAVLCIVISILLHNLLTLFVVFMLIAAAVCFGFFIKNKFANPIQK